MPFHNCFQICSLFIIILCVLLFTSSVFYFAYILHCLYGIIVIFRVDIVTSFILYCWNLWCASNLNDSWFCLASNQFALISLSLFALLFNLNYRFFCVGFQSISLFMNHDHKLINDKKLVFLNFATNLSYYIRFYTLNEFKLFFDQFLIHKNTYF